MDFVVIDTAAFGCEDKILQNIKEDLVVQIPVHNLVFRDWNSSKFYTSVSGSV